MTADPHPWAATLQDLHAQVWTRLKRGLNGRRAATRHPTLATVSADGRPQARTVVLRGADAASATLEVHTDVHSHTIAELRATPFAALHIWDPGAHLQLRLEADATILTGEALRPLWDRVPPASRVSYGTQPAPGTPIDEALAYVKEPDFAAFAVISLRLLRIEAMHLGPLHRRALFDRADGWQGVWLSP